MYGKKPGSGSGGPRTRPNPRADEAARRQREAEALVRQQEHPLYTNLGSRNVPRKPGGR